MQPISVAGSLGGLSVPRVRICGLFCLRLSDFAQHILLVERLTSISLVYVHARNAND